MNGESDGNRDVEEEIRAKFLLSASNYVNKMSSNTLRSHLNILCSDTLRMKSFAVPKKKDEKLKCQYCFTPWSCGDFSVKVLPVVKKGRKMKKIVEKMDAGEEVADIQRKIFNAAHFGNKVILKCLVCKNATSFKVNKELSKSSPVDIETPLPETGQKKKKKKKKKKQNKCCGLNPKVLAQLNNCGNSKMLQENTKKIKPLNRDVSEKGINKSGIDMTCRNSQSRKRKMEERKGKVPKKRKKKVQETIKAHSLPIIPLGSKHPAMLSMGKEHSSDFIPLENTNVLSKKMKSKSVFGNEKTSSQTLKGNTIVNPYSGRGQQLLNTFRSRKLSQWKRLIAEEEKKPQTSCSLADFLSSL